MALENPIFWFAIQGTRAAIRWWWNHHGPGISSKRFGERVISTRTSELGEMKRTNGKPSPIGSMYAIYANIGGILMGSMLPYIAYMDPMGQEKRQEHSLSTILTDFDWYVWKFHGQTFVVSQTTVGHGNCRMPRSIYIYIYASKPPKHRK